MLLGFILQTASAQVASDYPLTPVPLAFVRIDDGFWAPRMETNLRVTIPYVLDRCAQTGRIDNFARAAGSMPGPFQGEAYDDSDVYKALEAAAYALATHADPELERRIDELIATIAAAREPDGYLYTARTIHPDDPPGRAGPQRWTNERGALGGGDSHELYNAGHLYEAAVAYWRATGKCVLLDVAVANADLVAATWGPEGLDIPTGHPEIELALVRLFRATGDEKYVKLARFLLECRGRAAGPHPEYYADHLPVRRQEQAVGHAVRSGYLYAAMTDIAAMTDDAAYRDAVKRLWESVVGRKLYLTGGVGARGGGESFGDDYELPSDSAYAETCAAVALMLWQHRMFLLHGDGRCIDVLERTLYNGFLSGVSLGGDRFFYPNPLESDGRTPFNYGQSERAPWFHTSCCPVNVARILPQVAEWVYATYSNDLYVNLYVAGEATVVFTPPPIRAHHHHANCLHAAQRIPGAPIVPGDSPGGAAVAQGGAGVPPAPQTQPARDAAPPRNALRVVQETRYPWDGRVRITLHPPGERMFTLCLRIPGWAVGRPVPGDLYKEVLDDTSRVVVLVNDYPVEPRMHQGYARIRRYWRPGDVVELVLPMPVRRVVAHERVSAVAGRVAVERGPLTYCAEAPDNDGDLFAVYLPDDAPLAAEHREDLLGGVTVITAAARRVERMGDAVDAAGSEIGAIGALRETETKLMLIPYYAWANRGPAQMRVWLPRGAEDVGSAPR